MLIISVDFADLQNNYYYNQSMCTAITSTVYTDGIYNTGEILVTN